MKPAPKTQRLDDPGEATAAHAVEDRIFREVVRLREEGQPAALATVIGVKGSAPAREPMKILIRQDGVCLGSVGGGCLEEEVKRLARQVIEEDAPARYQMDLTQTESADSGLICGGRVEVYVEPISAPTLFIFGGGHVSLAVARLAARVGFRLIVTDDRPAYAAAERFPMAARTVVEFPETAAKSLAIEPLHYVLVMTRSHDDDQRILKALHDRGIEPRYLGMIGSATKIRLTYAALQEEGVAKDWLRRIRAPVGLKIGARSADEIAVSVVAELVAVRRGQ